MNQQQMQTLKAAVLADPDLAAIGRNDTELARQLNLPTTFWAWKTAVAQDELMGDGFDWTRVDNLSVGKARVWEWLFKNQSSSINPSKSNIRAGIDQSWVGTAADLAVRAAIYAQCARLATRAEQLLASGVGTQASPGQFDLQGSLTANDIGMMWNEG